MFSSERPGRPGGHHFTTARDTEDFAPWEMLTALRRGAGQYAQRRTNRGDVRTAILVLLAEKPMHGYQIMHEIEERSQGAWKPSPGSVYPTLQLLDDENLVEIEQSDGRKTYSLTPEGRAEADGAGDGAELWGTHGRNGLSGELPRAGARLGQAVAQVMRSGSAEEREFTAKTLDEARRAIYAMLAEQH